MSACLYIICGFYNIISIFLGLLILDTGREIGSYWLHKEEQFNGSIANSLLCKCENAMKVDICRHKRDAVKNRQLFEKIVRIFLKHVFQNSKFNRKCCINIL